MSLLNPHVRMMLRPRTVWPTFSQSQAALMSRATAENGTRAGKHQGRSIVTRAFAPKVLRSHVQCIGETHGFQGMDRVEPSKLPLRRPHLPQSLPHQARRQRKAVVRPPHRLLPAWLGLNWVGEGLIHVSVMLQPRWLGPSPMPPQLCSEGASPGRKAVTRLLLHPAQSWHVPGLQRLQSQCLRQVLDALDDLQKGHRCSRCRKNMDRKAQRNTSSSEAAPISSHQASTASSHKDTDTGGLPRSPLRPALACFWSARFK